MHRYSDWPFRSLCSELGSALSYTELVKAEFILSAFEHIRPRLHYTAAERPVVFQLYGADPAALLQAALRVQELAPDVIDINLGCPAGSVTDRGAGVALMRRPLQVARIFRRLSQALTVPVTGKIRLGWDADRNYALIARIIEENGGAAVAVHGRTREQLYSGRADWDAIAEVKQRVKIPVIGNGDVRTVADIERMKRSTGCDAVMIGRAAVGNPWIFARLDQAQVSGAMVLAMVRRHLERSLLFHGASKGWFFFRKHALQYLKLRQLPRRVRTEIYLQDDAPRFLALLEAHCAEAD